MCTVIVHVPHDDGAPVRLLAVRDEDPQRTWDPLGAWWPELPGVKGVRDRRAGGAWLAVDAEAGRVAVILNRADVLVADPTGQAEPPVSRGRIVLDAVAGRTPDSPPHAQGFNLVEATAAGARVTMWDGGALRRVDLTPGIHMIAHDDVDDEATARIAAWRDAFTAPDSAHARWWEPWLDTLERTSAVGSTDDRAIVRDNRPFGYPTLSLLVCAVSLGPDGVEARYAEFDEPGRWNRPHLH
ncbi:hypothetical protein HMPREF1529_01395 [Microbacterium sp. oral taxon 186 str. F0373]|uniref:NRDE family protein n=1 Tax=Microbacterium sp. oral taxon 186 TaxID=712383 RepID=UPI00034E97BC|nr:NRDE family protein [Microbacterium sp. oral taxon 186]EPD84789.1 hypothetical protein HMPREF1529_01395 [Microbacterium sp. oral taxon 186 str. F0373]